MKNNFLNISSFLPDPVHITWIPGKKRQKTVQKRILRLLKRFKAFYLNTKEDFFFVDGGAWVYKKREDGKYNKLVMHAKKFFPFIQSNVKSWRYEEEQYDTKNKKK
jgi:hypothetical protein